MSNRIPQQYAEKYILGGKARVVFHNIKTGNQRKFTILGWKTRPGYTVYQAEFGKKSLGTIVNGTFKPAAVYDDKNLLDSFQFMWTHIRNQTVPDYIHILHLGRCGVCGRTLTDAVSIERGIGPKCAGL